MAIELPSEVGTFLQRIGVNVEDAHQQACAAMRPDHLRAHATGLVRLNTPS